MTWENSCRMKQTMLQRLLLWLLVYSNSWYIFFLLSPILSYQPDIAAPLYSFLSTLSALCTLFTLITSPEWVAEIMLHETVQSRTFMKTADWCCWLAIETDGPRFEEEQQNSWRAVGASLKKFHIGRTFSPSSVQLYLVCYSFVPDNVHL